MSIVVAIKTQDGVVMGADTQGTYRGKKVDSQTKLYESRYSNTAWGGVGSCRFIQILGHFMNDLMNYEDILDHDTFDEHYIITRTLPRIRKLLEDQGLIEQKGPLELNGAMIMASPKCIYYVHPDGCVNVHTDFIATGSGEDLVIGYLNEVYDSDNIPSLEEGMELIKKAIIHSCKDNIYINSNIDFCILNKYKKDDAEYYLEDDDDEDDKYEYEDDCEEDECPHCRNSECECDTEVHVDEDKEKDTDTFDDKSKVKYIEFVFENCEVVALKPRMFRRLCAEGIRQNLIVNCYQYEDGEYDKQWVCDYFQVEVLEEGLKQKLTLEDNLILKERLERHSDIASVYIFYSDGTSERYFVPWPDDEEYTNTYQELSKGQEDNSLIITIKKG